MLDAYRIASRYDEGMALLDQLEQTYGIKPDVVTICTAVHLAEKTAHGDRAIEILKQMRDSDVEANTRTLTTAMRAFCKCGEFELVLRMFDEMWMGGFGEAEPNSMTYDVACLSCKIAVEKAGEESYSYYDEESQLHEKKYDDRYTELRREMGDCNIDYYSVSNGQNEVRRVDEYWKHVERNRRLRNRRLTEK